MGSYPRRLKKPRLASNHFFGDFSEHYPHRTLGSATDVEPLTSLDATSSWQVAGALCSQNLVNPALEVGCSVQLSYRQFVVESSDRSHQVLGKGQLLETCLELGLVGSGRMPL